MSSYPRPAPEPPDSEPEPSAVQPSPPAAGPGLPETPAATVLPPQISAATPLEQTLPPDSRSPLKWTDLVYLLLFYSIFGTVLLLLVARLFGISPGALQKPGPAQATVLIISQVLLSGATLGFLYVMVRGRSTAPFWHATGWWQFRSIVSSAPTIARYVFGGFGLALIVGWLGNFVGKQSPIPMEEFFRSRQSVLLLTALGILVAPVVEETIFRGCIYPVIARRFGIRAGILLTGILFGLAHAQQLGGAWGQVGLLMCVGIILTYVRARAGTVAASYLVHLGYNTILFAGFYFATGGLRHLPGA
jgi:CAAX protease family protein